MTSRLHRLLLPLLCIASALCVSLALSSVRDMGVSRARADVPALLDAGAAADGGSGSATAPASTLHDPSVTPGDFLHDFQDAERHGWGVAVLVGVFGLCEVLAAGGKKFTWLAFLGTGRVSIAIGAIAALASTSVASLANGGSWTAVAVSAISALLLYLHPAAQDVAKAQLAKA